MKQQLKESIEVLEKAATFADTKLMRDVSVGFIHLRRVCGALRNALQEVERLRKWQQDAIEVIQTRDQEAIDHLIGQKNG